MLTLTMRHSQHSDNTARVNSSNSGDEFVDILQVQQILLDSNRRDPPVLQTGGPPRLMMDTLSTSSYYYGSSTTYHHQTPPGSAGTTNMDELVAMWFSGAANSSVWARALC